MRTVPAGNTGLLTRIRLWTRCCAQLRRSVGPRLRCLQKPCLPGRESVRGAVVRRLSSTSRRSRSPRRSMTWASGRDGTFDYLQPSVQLASALPGGFRKKRLDARDHRDDSSASQGVALPRQPAVACRAVPPRRWADVSMGLITFGLPRTLVREVQSMWPSEGFHKRLIQLELRQLRTHPWHPLPMVKL